MAAVILPSKVKYQPFTDEQIRSFADAANIKYASHEDKWRKELDEVARELLIDCISKNWPTPSMMLKELKRLARKPDDFFAHLPAAADLPVATAILHGTGWHPDRLNDAAMHREEFAAGIEREIAFLERIVDRRKEMKMTGNGGKPGIRWFVERLAWVFQDAFLTSANYRVNSVTLDGPYVIFSKAVILALVENHGGSIVLADALNELRKVADVGAEIAKHLMRSSYWKVHNRSSYHLI